MVKITLKGGVVREYDEGVCGYEVAASIGAGLAKSACAITVNGNVCDLRTPIYEDCELSILTFDDEDGRWAYRHTASHILAQAVKRIYPECKLAIGPAVDGGFYYDFDTDVMFTPERLADIEDEMKNIIKEEIILEKVVVSRDEAIELFTERDEPYKLELINDLPEDAEISLYKQGDFVDLCAGPHLLSTGFVKAVKLTSCTGAYWRGDASRKMLQRVYGTAFPKASQLEEHLLQLEEAKKRDHNKLGRELELFTTSDVIGQGLPIMLP